MPVIVLSCMEVFSARKGSVCEGYEKISRMVDPDAEKEPGPEMKAAVKSFSFAAFNFFSITIAAIAVILLALLAVHDPKTMAVKGVVTGFVAAISAVIAGYVAYRIIDSVKNKKQFTKPRQS